MGLNINVYSELKKIDTNLDGVVLNQEEYYRPCVNQDFPDHANNLDPNAVYEFKEIFEFSAGCYSSYSVWLNNLAKLAASQPLYDEESGTEQRGGAFWELISFSDAEGVIGPVFSKKLASDFSENKEKAHATGDEYFIEQYDLWHHVFEVAANGGCVEFC